MRNGFIREVLKLLTIGGLLLFVCGIFIEMQEGYRGYKAIAEDLGFIGIILAAVSGLFLLILRIVDKSVINKNIVNSQVIGTSEQVQPKKKYRTEDFLILAGILWLATGILYDTDFSRFLPDLFVFAMTAALFGPVLIALGLAIKFFRK